MRYSEVIFECKGGEGWQQDLLIGDLAAMGFDTFEEKGESGFAAYIAYEQFDPVALDLLLIHQPVGFSFTYTHREILPQNWNAVWESNFQPIRIDDRCYVRATFHEAQPQFEYEIVIDPKMAFGTGHHQTTSMMMRFLLDRDIQGKSVLDMGSGTGILAILAAKRGAASVLAIDNDPVCQSSAVENINLNDTPDIEVDCGSVDLIKNREFDIILANINRNVLLEHLPAYVQSMKKNAFLYLSGFFVEEDLEIIKEAAFASGLVFDSHLEDGPWAAACFFVSSNC